MRGEGASLEQVAAVQRSRLLAAALREIDERGYAAATVAHITDRARVSRRTFYELFANREGCLLAVLEQAVAAVERDLAEADLDGSSWRERVREGLWVILSFLDREPALARVCVVQALGAGSSVLERREAILSRLAKAVDEGRLESPRAAGCNPLTAEGVVGAALAIVYARLLRRDPEPLRNLIRELAGMIVLPYLGQAAARREQLRPAPALSSQDAAHAAPDPRQADGDPLAGVPMRLTYRTMRVLRTVAEAPGVSNRAVGDVAGMSDQGQISKLLARLERLGLIANASTERLKGLPNAWHLTSAGEQFTQAIHLQADRQATARSSSEVGVQSSDPSSNRLHTRRSKA